MYYISIDGDDIGREITKYYLMNNEKKLKEFSTNLCKVTKDISNYLIEMHCSIIFSAADGIVASFTENINIEEIFYNIQKINSHGITFSAGVGGSLQEAYVSLLYSKSNGKNCLTLFSKIQNKENN